MTWLIAILVIALGIIAAARGKRRARPGARVDLGPTGQAAGVAARRPLRASRRRPGIDVPRQWHPYRPSATGDLWLLGAGAALLAEREREARHSVLSDPDTDRCNDDDIGGGDVGSKDVASDSNGGSTIDDFSGGGGSSGGGGAAGEWSGESSESSSDSGSDSSDAGSD